MRMPGFKRKNYRNSGKMVGQAFNPSGVRKTDPLVVHLMLEVGESVWKAIGETPLDEAREKYPHAKRFMRLLGFNSTDFAGKAIPRQPLQSALF